MYFDRKWGTTGLILLHSNLLDENHSLTTLNTYEAIPDVE